MYANLSQFSTDDLKLMYSNVESDIAALREYHAFDPSNTSTQGNIDAKQWLLTELDIEILYRVRFIV